MKRATIAWIALVLGAGGAAIAAGAAGSLDSSFGDQGIATTAVVGQGGLFALGRQTTGKLIAAGRDEAANAPWAVRRYNVDGSLDTTFEAFGIAPGGASDGFAYDVAVDSSDRILIVGDVTIEVTSGKGKKQKTSTKRVIAVVRLTADGAADTAFGDGGEVLLDVGGSAQGVSLQADGRILVSGKTVATSRKGPGGKGKKTTSEAILLMRLEADGTLDDSFGDEGIVVDDVTSGNDIVRIGADAQFQSDGRIVVNGDTDVSQWFLRRYNADGTVDTGFGSDGIVLLPVNDRVFGIAVDSQDRILATGWRGHGGNVSEGSITRYLANGSLDTAFGSSGVWLSGAPDREELQEVRELSDGKIVAGGMFWPVDGSTFVIDAIAYRLNADGTEDGSFGVSGQSDLSTPGDGRVDGVRDMVVDASGNITLAGESFLSGTTNAVDWLLARYCGN